MASIVGMKRASERIMEKCDGCRIKRVKCIPTSRVWEKGERCLPCETRGEPCGPNKRAPKSARRKAAPDLRPTDRVLAPSPPQRCLALAPPSALEDPASCAMPAISNCEAYEPVLGSVTSDANQMLLPNPPEQAGASQEAVRGSEQNDRITLSLIKIGDLRMTLHNVASRLRSVSSNIPQCSNSSDGKAEIALDFIENCIRDRYRTEIKNILTLIEGPESSHAEPALRRALDAIDYFLSLIETPVTLKAAECDSILESKVTVLHKLVSIYNERGDFPEAERLLIELSKVLGKLKVPDGPEITSRLAESHTKTSKRMHDVLVGLGIPQKYTNSLHLLENAPFPAIHRALLAENESVAQHLWESTPMPHKEVDILGRRPVHVVAETSNLGLLELVHFKEHNVLQVLDIGRRTPLGVAAYIGDLMFFEKLFHAGADFESRDEEGRSIMCVACGAGHYSIVRFLLDRKISPNDAAFTDYCFPLYAAASAGHLEVCRILLEAGAWTNFYSHKLPTQVAMENNHCDVANLIGEFVGRPENSWSLTLDTPAPNEPSFCSPTFQPAPPPQHADGVYSAPPAPGPVSEDTCQRRTDSADDTDASYEIVNSEVC